RSTVMVDPGWSRTVRVKWSRNAGPLARSNEPVTVTTISPSTSTFVHSAFTAATIATCCEASGRAFGGASVTPSHVARRGAALASPAARLSRTGRAVGFYPIGSGFEALGAHRIPSVHAPGVAPRAQRLGAGLAAACNETGSKSHQPGIKHVSC